MGSGRGWLVGDWPSTGGVLNITVADRTAGFHWWRSGNKKRTQNVSEYMLVLALCLVSLVRQGSSTYLVITRQICLDYCNAALCDWTDQQCTADEVLIFTGERRPIGREFHPHWTHHRRPGPLLRVKEQPVPVRQESVAGDDRGADGGEVDLR